MKKRTAYIVNKDNQYEVQQKLFDSGIFWCDGQRCPCDIFKKTSDKERIICVCEEKKWFYYDDIETSHEYDVQSISSIGDNKTLKLRAGKTYLTRGGYVVKMKTNHYAEKYCSAGETTSDNTILDIPDRTNGWSYISNGDIIGLKPEWNDKLKIIKELNFDLTDPPEGFKWKDGFPIFREPKAGEWVQALNSNKLGKSIFLDFRCGHKRIILEKIEEENNKININPTTYSVKVSNEDEFNKVQKILLNNNYLSTKTGSRPLVYNMNKKYLYIHNNRLTPCNIPLTNNFTFSEFLSLNQESTTMPQIKSIAKTVASAPFRYGWKLTKHQANYWLYEPVTRVLTKSFMAVRYIVAIGLISGSVGGSIWAYNNMDVIMDHIPRINIEWQQPEVDSELV